MELTHAVDARWLANPDTNEFPKLLDFARGVIRSLAGSEHGVAPFHVLGVRAAFVEIRRPVAYRLALGLLTQLREAEELRNGYWVTAPHRLIDLGGEGYVFVGALPLEELPFAKCVTRGLARLVEDPIGVQLPKQDLQTWAGIDHTRPTDLLARLERTHLENQRVTIPSDQTEYLNVIGGASGAVWTKRPARLTLKSDIALCRERSAYGSRYFLASLKSGRIVNESSLTRPPAEILPAVAAARGVPLIAKVRQIGKQFEFILPRPVPAAIRRIFRLMAEAKTTTRTSLHASLPSPFHSSASSALCASGYLLESEP